MEQPGTIEAHDLDDGELFRNRVADHHLGGKAEGLEAAVVAAFLAEVDQHLALALEELLHRIDDAGGADLFVLIGGEAAAQAEGVDGAAIAGAEDLGANDRRARIGLPGA